MKLSELAYFTDSVREMKDFYRALLSAEPVSHSDDMAIFIMGKTRIFIHRNYLPCESDLRPNKHIAFAVEDVDTTCRTLMQQGLVMEIPPKDYYWGRSAYLRDPDGHQVEITRE